jgi:multiple sugar transport system permease protein
MADVMTLRKVKSGITAGRNLTAAGFGPRIRRNLSAHGFLIGAVLCFTFFSWYPIVREIIMSFQKAVYGGGYAWAGFANYDTIFHDPTFWQAWRNTLEFTLLALVIGYAVPFGVAILLNELRHARGYLRILVYLPVMLPPASALLLFVYFYNPQYGLFDEILRVLHLPVSQWVLQPGTGFISTAMIAVVIASTWMNMGGATLIYLAAAEHPRRTLRGGRTRRGRAVLPDQEHHDPADQADPAHAGDAAGRRDHADVRRVVRADQWRRRSRR